jgi:sugar phosphate isomerase/epimerase
MNKGRRNFIRNASLMMAGSAFASKNIFSAPLSAKGKELVGVQLYSVRDDMKKDPYGTLKQLAEMGYKYAEHAANPVDRKYYGYSAYEFRKILDGLGIHMPSGHTRMDLKHWDAAKKDFTDAWKYTVEDAAILGQQYVISPSMEKNARTNYDELLQFMDVFNKSGELCKKSGMKFGYHNHDFEFSEKLNGEMLYDIILKNTDPNLVIQQLDIGNLYNGGGNASEIVKKYPGRFSSLHVKDEVPASGGNEKYESALLGTGIVNVKTVINLVRQHTKDVHYIIEQESYQGKTPLASAKENLAIMKKWGF